MTNKLTEQIKKSGEKVNKEFGNGSEKYDIPLYVNLPEIKSFLTHSQIELLKVLKEEVEGLKVGYENGFFDSDYKHQIYERGEKFGFNSALSRVIDLIDNVIKVNEKNNNINSNRS